MGADDTLFAYVYMDAASPPKELMLQWHTKGNWSHRAYWGGNLIDFGKDATPERLRLGELPPRGKWTRLEVPVQKLKLEPGTEIEGWAFTQFDGTVYWDKAGIETRTPQDGQRFDSLSAWLRAVRGGASGGVPENIKKIAALDRAKRSETQTKELKAYFIEHASSKTAKASGAVAGEGRAGAAAPEGARGAAAGHADLSREGRHAQAGVLAETRRI